MVRTRLAPVDAMRRLRSVLEEDMKFRILEESPDGMQLITSPRHFATDTGPGQPAGGRQYYTQLLIRLSAREGGTEISITPHNYELRTSYAYSSEGQIRTLYKIYPYEEYPGMFDLIPLLNELSYSASAIQLGLAQ